jgi:4-hydroxyphenylpyruvate dioxygenase
VIHTDYSALMSKVMQNGNGRIKFPINEPASRQEEEPDPGVSRLLPRPGHAAHRAAHRGHRRHGAPLRERGVEFLGMPHAYYEKLPDRVGDVGVPMETLEELGIEADRDEEGYLLQIFTRPVQDRPTFFFEIIERHGSRGFGVGNFKALFEAIEIEQAARQPLDD